MPTDKALSPVDSTTPSVTGARRFRGPFARWPRTADTALAVVAFLLALFVVDAPGDALTIRPLAEVAHPAVAALLAGNAVLYWRRRAPLIVLGSVLLSWMPLLLTGYSHLGPAALVALYSVGRYGTVNRWYPAGIAVIIVLLIGDGLDDPTPWWQEILVGGIFMFGAWNIGYLLRSRAERAARLLREGAAEADRILAEERTRIARELHDVVAHRVSLMTVQAGAAKVIATRDLDAAVRAMGAVEEAGRQALAEMRHLLDVLRPETELGPQPGLADLPRLVEQIRGAGVHVSLSADGLPAAVPARVDLFAYRIVQEALTNVLKHAGPGTHAQTRLDVDRNAIVIEVLDDGRGTAVVPGPPVAPPGSGGHGIIGMRERALLLGGSLEAGPRTQGGFLVVAQLPIGDDRV
ncbi:sensor histidine kinase [Nocardia sp. 004]|uniref:sensor histidine kinase n=1 Tax=Nocardia sp. 004 TaxID=3385978 RepID=UPI0039A05621